ncbi:MAG: ABC transporter substrate-binding protein [Geminicoccaceae bacterium]
MTKIGTLALGLMLGGAPFAHAETFSWSTGSDPTTMDPHAVATAPVLGFLNNIYEGLVRRGPDMVLEPSLAESWEAMGSDGWRFRLRDGVTFHDGATFDADDVLFSYERASSDSSDIQAFFATIDRVEAPDPLTVEFYTKQPDPLFPSGVANWLIMDRGWTEDKGAALPSKEGGTPTSFEANGTGPFKLISREPDVETVLEPFDGWWGEVEHNLTRAVYKPLKADATRVAALISGGVDMIEPVPLQNVTRLEAADGIEVLSGVESRVIFFGFDHRSEALALGDAGGANPFKDVRVRKAIYQAIDAEVIVQQVMRGNAQTSGLLIAPGVNGYQAEDDVRLATDLAAAKAALAEAGFPDGFSTTLRCPNDRYVNDEAICTAAVSMLAKLGLDVTLDAAPVSQYWTELREGRFDMYLLGWSPGTFDAEHPIRFLMHTPDAEKKLGSWNFGGYSNPDVDQLLPMIQQELDETARQGMIDKVNAILQEDAVYVPLHVQPLVWATRTGIQLQQRPDNFLILRWIRMN